MLTNEMKREQQENAARQAAREQRAAYIASVGYDASVSARVNGPNAAREQEAETGRAIVQTVFPRIDIVKHENRASLFAFDGVIIAPPVARIHPDTRPDTGRIEAALTAKEKKAAREHDKKNPYLDGRLPKRDDEIANDIILKRNEKTGKMMKKSNGAPKRKQLGAPTCEALFTMGEKETDGFSRTIALRYLCKRMVFAPRSNAKGKEAAPRKLKERKTSSSQHKTPLYIASDIEDIIQDAFLLWQEGRKQTGEKKYATGNKLHDTCDACRDARRNVMRAKHKEKKRIDILAARMKEREDKERGIAARFDNWLDGKSELSELMDAAREHGTTNAIQLAEILKTYPMDISRRFARIRANAERAERFAAQ